MSIILEESCLYPESIIVRKYIGKIGINDIIDSWDYILKNNLINSKTKGLINNLTECELNFDIKSFKSLIEYMKKQPKFKKVRIAVIAITPAGIVFPTICEKEATELKIRPFSTMAAAVNWILVN